MGIISVQDTSKQYAYRFSWFHLFRPMTFSGTLSPIIAGTAVAALHGPIQIELFLVLITAALFVQISANMFNDYFDFKHGQDQEKWTTDQTTGPLYKKVPIAALTCIGVAIILGAWLSIQTTWWFALVGSIGILAGIGYSAGSHSFSAIGLGEVIAAIFLGFVTTILGYTVQAHSIDASIIAVAFTYALLISTMILTNNIRDFKKDQGFRHTLAKRIGKQNAIRLLTGIIITTYVWGALLIISGGVPWTACMIVFAIPVAYRLRLCFRNGSTRKEEISAMKWAGKHHWTFGLLFALGIGLGLL